jgi:hypothetical protein
MLYERSHLWPAVFLGGYSELPLLSTWRPHEPQRWIDSKYSTDRWVFIDQHRYYGYTIRWRRGDTVAYVLRGKKLGDHGMADVLGHYSGFTAGVD